MAIDLSRLQISSFPMATSPRRILFFDWKILDIISKGDMCIIVQFANDAPAVEIDELDNFGVTNLVHNISQIDFTFDHPNSASKFVTLLKKFMS